MRSETATPQLPSHLMRAQLGFMCGGTPAQSGKSGGHQLAYHTHVETHDALFSWRVKAMTIESHCGMEVESGFDRLGLRNILSKMGLRD